MALTNKLSAIGNAIREKTGGTDLLTLDQMPAEIASITTGSGGEVEPIVLTGDCNYACAGVLSSKYIENFGDTISTEDITDASYMFDYSTVKRIPFEINMKLNTMVDVRTMFANNPYLEEAPVINNLKINYTYGLYYLFNGCNNLRNLPENFGENWDWSSLHENNASGGGYAFQNCYSLRKIPTYFLKNMWNCGTGTHASQSSAFLNCYALDEIIDFGISTKRYTSNTFTNTFASCRRLANLTFETNEDGTPKAVEWKNQTIDLTNFTGEAISYTDFTNYNSGITADKEVKDDATYQALKNDPDWFGCTVRYNRYNHDSAVRTINSLPDASAYLATTTGTNTIKFRGPAGALTDGGAINTLTEEEIAVATAKGWTVSLV